MYGKHFASMYSGSMVGSGPTVFAVWGYIIANVHQRTQTVEINNKVLSIIIGCTENEIQDAIDYLCNSDPRSRNKEEDGKRLIKVDEYMYFVVSANKYNKMVSEEHRRTYQKEYKREYRAKNKDCKQVSTHVNKCQQTGTKSIHEDEDEEVEEKEINETNCAIPIEKQNKDFSQKDFVSPSLKNSILGSQKLSMKLKDLFAIEAKTSDYTSICNLSQKTGPEQGENIIAIALKCLDNPTSRKPIALFFSELKRLNIYTIDGQ